MNGSSFQTLGAATEEARLPKLSLVFGTTSCCEIDDLSCLVYLNNSSWACSSKNVKFKHPESDNSLNVSRLLL